MKNRDTRGPGRLRRGFRAWIGRAVVAAWCWIGSAAFVGSTVQGAAQSADRIAFDAGRRDFDNGLWDRVVQEFTGFEATFPRSALRPEAGELKAFAQGEAAADRGEHRVAADFFAQFRQAFPAAPGPGWRPSARPLPARSWAIRGVPSMSWRRPTARSRGCSRRGRSRPWCSAGCCSRPRPIWRCPIGPQRRHP